MVRPLSLDLRERIVAAVEGGLSRRAAERFQVSERYAIKLLQRWKRTGSMVPGRMGGSKRFAHELHEVLAHELIVVRRMRRSTGWRNG